MTEHKTYLGDAVYVDVDEATGGLVLTVEYGTERVAHEVFLEASVYRALVAWVDGMKQKKGCV